MFNLLNDTLYSWRYHSQGNVTHSPTGTDYDHTNGYGPIAAFESYYNRLTQSFSWLASQTQIEEGLSQFSTDYADAFYVASDYTLDYGFSGAATNDYILSVAGGFSGKTGKGKDVVILDKPVELIEGTTDTWQPLYSGDHSVKLGSGADLVMSLTYDDNTLFGQKGNDVMFAFGHNNYAHGGRGHDTIFTVNLFQDSNSVLIGGRGQDTLIALGQGSATLNGGRGADNLVGMTTENVLNGGRGNDHLWAAGLKNDLTGGRGADQFIFTQNAELDNEARISIVRDFQVGIDYIGLGYNDDVSNITNDFAGNISYTSEGTNLIVQTDFYGTIVFENLTAQDQDNLINSFVDTFLIA